MAIITIQYRNARTTRTRPTILERLDADIVSHLIIGEHSSEQQHPLDPVFEECEAFLRTQLVPQLLFVVFRPPNSAFKEGMIVCR